VRTRLQLAPPVHRRGGCSCSLAAPCLDLSQRDASHCTHLRTVGPRGSTLKKHSIIKCWHTAVSWLERQQPHYAHRNEATQRPRPAHAAGTAWAGAVGLSFAAQLGQATPMTLKLFQTRIYAQAFTVAALCGAAAITMSEEPTQEQVCKRPCCL
jgi:Hypoxia induced protein conserved region